MRNDITNKKNEMHGVKSLMLTSFNTSVHVQTNQVVIQFIIQNGQNLSAVSCVQFVILAIVFY